MKKSVITYIAMLASTSTTSASPVGVLLNANASVGTGRAAMTTTTKAASVVAETFDIVVDLEKSANE